MEVQGNEIVSLTIRFSDARDPALRLQNYSKGTPGQADVALRVRPPMDASGNWVSRVDGSQREFDPHD